MLLLDWTCSIGSKLAPTLPLRAWKWRESLIHVPVEFFQNSETVLDVLELLLRILLLGLLAGVDLPLSRRVNVNSLKRRPPVLPGLQGAAHTRFFSPS